MSELPIKTMLRDADAAWKAYEATGDEQLGDLACHVRALAEENEQLKIKYLMLLDSATNLRETVKDLYNASCFGTALPPPDGMLEEFRKIVHEATNKALIETVSVARIQYAIDMGGETSATKTIDKIDRLKTIVVQLKAERDALIESCIPERRAERR